MRIRPELGTLSVLFDHPVDRRQGLVQLALAQGDIGQPALGIHHHLDVRGLERQDLTVCLDRFFQAAEVHVNLALLVFDACREVSIRDLGERLLAGFESLFDTASPSQYVDLDQVRLGPELGGVLVFTDQGVECFQRILYPALAHGDAGQAALGIHHHPCVGRLEGQHLFKGLFCLFQTAPVPVNLAFVMKDTRLVARLIRNLRDRYLTELERFIITVGRSKHIDLCHVCIRPEPRCVLVFFDHPVDRRQSLFRPALAHGNVGQAALDFREHLCIGGLELQHLVIRFFCFLKAAEAMVNLPLIMNDARQGVLFRNPGYRQSTDLESLFGTAGHSKHIDLRQIGPCAEPGGVLVLLDQGVHCGHGLFRLALAHEDVGQAALGIHHHPCVGRLERQHLAISLACFFQSTEVPVNLALDIQDARHVLGLIRDLGDRLFTGLEGLFGAAGRSEHIDLSTVCLGPELGGVLVLFDQGVECRHRLFRPALAHGDVGQAALHIHHHPRVGRLELQNLVISFFCIFQSTEVPVDLALGVHDARLDVGLIRDACVRQVTSLDGLFVATGHSKHLDLSLVSLCPEPRAVLVLFDEGVERRQRVLRLALTHGDVGQIALDLREYLVVGRVELQHPGISISGFLQLTEVPINLALIMNDPCLEKEIRDLRGSQLAGR